MMQLKRMEFKVSPQKLAYYTNNIVLKWNFNSIGADQLISSVCIEAFM